MRAGEVGGPSRSPTGALPLEGSNGWVPFSRPLCWLSPCSGGLNISLVNTLAGARLWLQKAWGELAPPLMLPCHENEGERKGR